MEAYLACRTCYGDVGTRPIEMAVFDLFRGLLPPSEIAVDLAVRLSEPVESGYPFESIAAIFAENFSMDEAQRLLKSASDRDGEGLAARLATYSALLARMDSVAALAVAERACSIGPDPVGSLADWRKHLQQEISAMK